jgi:isopentenyl-diphosphate delta-isomerase type 1
MVADKANEIFEIVDEDDKVIGTEKRSVVHEKGLLHRAVDVFVFDKEGRIFIQQRSFKKLIGPGLWDVSTAEHLKPGETYEEAAVRGVKEELGVRAVGLRKIGEREQRSNYGELRDNEKKEVFRCGFRGRIKLDENEVEQGIWVSKDSLLREIAYNKDFFTRWLVEDIKKFGHLL